MSDIIASNMKQFVNSKKFLFYFMIINIKIILLKTPKNNSQNCGINRVISIEHPPLLLPQAIFRELLLSHQLGLHLHPNPSTSCGPAHHGGAQLKKTFNHPARVSQNR